MEHKTFSNLLTVLPELIFRVKCYTYKTGLWYDAPLHTNQKRRRRRRRWWWWW